MFQCRPHRSVPRTRSLALGGALAALAVVGGGTVAAVSAPTEVAAGDILLAQNTAAQEMALGEPIRLDLEPVVAGAAGGAIPSGTTVQVTGLPDGLTQEGWVISGTPTRAGDYDVLVTVTNGAVSESEKLIVTVTDTPGRAATAPAVTDAPDADDESGNATAGGGEAATAPDEEPAATNPSAQATGQTDPTLSAAAGDPALQGAGDGVTLDDGDATGASPDLCAVLGDGAADGVSLTRLLPALTGDDDAASSGLVLTLVNAIVGMLPSVLGEGGSMDDLGSAGQFLCTLSPSLLGGDPADQGGTEAETTADLGGAPTALLGLLTGGAGSLGD